MALPSPYPLIVGIIDNDTCDMNAAIADASHHVFFFFLFIFSHPAITIKLLDLSNF